MEFFGILEFFGIFWNFLEFWNFFFFAGAKSGQLTRHGHRGGDQHQAEDTQVTDLTHSILQGLLLAPKSIGLFNPLVARLQKWQAGNG